MNYGSRNMPRFGGCRPSKYFIGGYRRAFRHVSGLMLRGFVFVGWPHHLYAGYFRTRECTLTRRAAMMIAALLAVTPISITIAMRVADDWPRRSMPRCFGFLSCQLFLLYALLATRTPPCRFAPGDARSRRASFFTLLISEYMSRCLPLRVGAH